MTTVSTQLMLASHSLTTLLVSSLLLLNHGLMHMVLKVRHHSRVSMMIIDTNKDMDDWPTVSTTPAPVWSTLLFEMMVRSQR